MKIKPLLFVTVLSIFLYCCSGEKNKNLKNVNSAELNNSQNVFKDINNIENEDIDKGGDNENYNLYKTYKALILGDSQYQTKEINSSKIINRETEIEDRVISYAFSPIHSAISNFSRNEEMQLNSINFPLEIIKNGNITLMQREEWEYRYYGFGAEFSSILFMNNSPENKVACFRIMEDSTVVVPVFLKPEKSIQSFYFKKNEKDKWLLEKISFEKIEPTEEESFFDFIDKYSIDLNFKKERIGNNAVLVTWKNDIPDEIIEKQLNKTDINETSEYIYNRIYIGSFDMQSDKAALHIKGEGTGYSSIEYFKKINSKWYLVKSVGLGV